MKPHALFACVLPVLLAAGGDAGGTGGTQQHRRRRRGWPHHGQRGRRRRRRLLVVLVDAADPRAHTPPVRLRILAPLLLAALPTGAAHRLS